ncbi:MULTISPECIES: BglII/BstYI family type II restriction endonuclease [unclassified Nostoc]|uniref:BglII/BstYI family type II restriction endonuclease n=1 Tax=unclassified Nostoc TaxID=2593658 RepID=UPI002FFA9E83
MPKGDIIIIIQYVDFNAADRIINTQYQNEWHEISTTLTRMPLHIKASDQAGIQGNAIFDPVGTNEYVKAAFIHDGWQSNIPIPGPYRFLGTDVDFAKTGIIIEIQFSNYPFLLNNTLRSELFFKAKTEFVGYPTNLVIIVTKALMFPASNSTLYYEQAVNQLTALAKNQVFDVPIRLVGLFEQQNTIVPIIWTEYLSKRYSRTVNTRVSRQCQIIAGRTARSRCLINLL